MKVSAKRTRCAHLRSPEKTEKITPAMQATLSVSSPTFFFNCGILLKRRGTRRGLGIAANIKFLGQKKEATELRFEL